MADLIDRQALIKAAEKKKFGISDNTHPYKAVEIVGKYFREVVENAPTVDAIPIPCKMGDEVWGLRKTRYSLRPEKGIVHHMYFGEDMRVCICVKNVCRGEWGKNVFATYEEAEAALAKIGGGNEDGK